LKSSVSSATAAALSGRAIRFTFLCFVTANQNEKIRDA